MSHDSSRRIVILTEGHSEPITAKTGVCVLRYRPEEVVAVYDTHQAGRTVGEVLGVGGDTPVIGQLAAAPEANTLLVGIAPSGGKIPVAWRPVVLEAIRRGMNILSGLHDFMSDDPEFAAAARQHGVKLIDVRKNDEKDVPNRKGIRDDCIRIHTVGNDCSIGKMVVSVEIARGLQARGRDAKFVATGQTGIMIEGDGCPIDRVVSDFVSGAVEKLVLANQHHEFMVIEGQACLTHPRYSGVTLSLLHGCMPHGMVMCYEAGRTHVHGMEHIPLKPLDELVRIYETMANLQGPSRFIGVGMNSRKFNAQQAEEERERVSRLLGLPVCDVIRDGPDALVEAALALAPVAV